MASVSSYTLPKASLGSRDLLGVWRMENRLVGLRVGSAHIPNVRLSKISSDGKTELSFETANAFSNGFVALFFSPGAFNPTCTKKLLPTFAKAKKVFEQNKVRAFCVVTSNKYPVYAWAKSQEIDPDLMIADEGADFTYLAGFADGGFETRRGAMLLYNGKVLDISMEYDPLVCSSRSTPLGLIERCGDVFKEHIETLDKQIDTYQQQPCNHLLYAFMAAERLRFCIFKPKALEPVPDVELSRISSDGKVVKFSTKNTLSEGIVFLYFLKGAFDPAASKELPNLLKREKLCEKYKARQFFVVPTNRNTAYAWAVEHGINPDRVIPDEGADLAYQMGLAEEGFKPQQVTVGLCHGLIRDVGSDKLDYNDPLRLRNTFKNGFEEALKVYAELAKRKPTEEKKEKDK